MNDLPDRLARAEGLEVHEARDGLVAFNPATDRVHHLNRTSSVLLELCDGSHATSELPELVAALFELEEPPLDAIAAGLRELVDEGVLVPTSSAAD